MTDYNTPDLSYRTNVDFRIGDNKDLIQELESESIDISLTSPPYKNEDFFESIDFDFLFAELYRVHKDNTLFYLNFGHLANFKERPFQVMLKALDQGWKLNDTITWVKPQYSPIQGNKRLNNLTEFIFLLYKGNMPNLDRLAIGQEYCDKSNITRYSKNGDLKCGGNVWKIGYETITNKSQKLHNDRFPEKLAENCIKLSGLKSGTLLDIFGGSGTSGIVAEKLGLDFIGFEKNPKYKEVFELRRLS